METEQIMQLYQAQVMEHSRKPRNYYELEDASHRAEGWNRLCGDRVKVHLKLSPEGKILASSFSGESCAICKASASMLMEKLSGMGLEEVKELLTRLQQFTEDWQPDSRLGKFEAFLVMKDFPTRLKCLRLPWRTLEAALTSESRQVSTEEEVES